MSFDTSELISIHGPEWIENQRVAGQVVAQCLTKLSNKVKEGSSLSLLEMSKEIEEFILDSGCTPTFKGYKGFPEAVCISVNKQVVHGVPTSSNLEEGDVVSFDLGATYREAIADSAITCIFGAPRDESHLTLLQVTEKALMAGIGAVKVGDRIGGIGAAIQKAVKDEGFGIITKYGGHGISYHVHSDPFISNIGRASQGSRIYAGMSIAIEPMLVVGGPQTFVDKEDKWTVYAEGISAHFEHTLFVHEDRVEIMTDRNLSA